MLIFFRLFVKGDMVSNVSMPLVEISNTLIFNGDIRENKDLEKKINKALTKTIETLKVKKASLIHQNSIYKDKKDEGVYLYFSYPFRDFKKTRDELLKEEEERLDNILLKLEGAKENDYLIEQEISETLLVLDKGREDTFSSYSTLKEKRIHINDDFISNVLDYKKGYKKSKEYKEMSKLIKDIIYFRIMLLKKDENERYEDCLYADYLDTLSPAERRIFTSKKQEDLIKGKK